MYIKLNLVERIMKKFNMMAACIAWIGYRGTTLSSAILSVCIECIKVKHFS